MARSHTAMAISVLAGVARSRSAPEAARVAAANSLLDRGWGKAPQVGQVNADIRVVVRQIIDNAGEIAGYAAPELIDVTPGGDAE